jgi:Suppressor of fused protein (SUFU)
MNIFNFKKKAVPEKKTPIEKYLEHLDNIFQMEPIFWGGGKDENGLPKTSVMIYKDVPEIGFITGITYGLSLVKHPEWKLGRPELCISVKSTNESWGHVAGFIANRLRGDCPFCYGETINFGEQISEDSEMDAFFIFAPSTLDKNAFLNIDIGTDYKINIAGLYPIYSDELKTFEEIGLEKFWHHPNFDNYSVKRKRITTAE